MPKRTKIIATIGPNSSKPSVISKMIKAGIDAARLNFSHGEYREHEKRIKRIRQASKSAGRHIAIIQDLQGPKIRVGMIENDSVLLRVGDKVTITSRDVLGTSSLIPVTYSFIVRDLKKGDRVLLDDGKIELKIVKKTADGMIARTIRGGVLKSRKGVNLPGARLSIPALTDKDKQDVLFGLEHGIDYIALSFVRTARDILNLKKYIGNFDVQVPVIAKIEKPEAIDNLDEIIHAADGVMVARGDLGVEMSAEKVPLLQKRIIEACNKAEKPVITATQMLESMIENPQPTRAEASDVANAILDGTDCVMLSGETAVGKYPVQAVEFMARIAEEAEAAIRPRESDAHIAGLGESVAHAACRAAEEQGAKAIVAFTQSGATALLVSKHRPSVPVIAATPSEVVARKVSLYWGVAPLILRTKHTTDDMIKAVEAAMLARRLVRKGDIIVITAGVPVGVPGSTNMLKLHRVGEGRSLEAK